MTELTKPQPYRPQIDGLRAVAVIPVLLFHAGFSWFSGGYVGVDVFFVISGYLITTNILHERAAGAFSILNFYERRSRRILPALFLVMLACVVPAWLWMSPLQLAEFSQSITAVALFASNVWFWLSRGYFAPASAETPLLHTWSLGVEEQYYILFPLAMLALWRLGRRRQIITFSLLAVASLALAEFGGRDYRDASFYLPFTRAWELLMGSLLAYAGYAAPRSTRVPIMTAQMLSATGLAMIAGAVVGFEHTTRIPGLLGLVPTIGAALVLAFASDGTWVARVLSSRVAVGIGLISYSTYLWHQPLLAFARIRSLAPLATPALLAICAATLGLGYFTWRFIEVPFRDRHRVSRQQVFAFSIAGSIAIIVLGSVGQSTGGFPGRFEPSVLALAATAIPSPKRTACHTSGVNFLDPAQACVYANDNVTWAVLGDSHVTEPAYALAEELARRGQGLVHLTFSGCPPSLETEVDPPGCTRWQQRAVARIEGDARIRNVLVGYRFREYLPDVRGDGASAGGGLMWRELSLIVDRLQRAGKRVVVLMPIPQMAFDIKKRIFTAAEGELTTMVGAQRSEYARDDAVALTQLEHLPWSGSLIKLDPASALCDRDQCYAVIDGAAMYFDDNHLSVAGARRVMTTVSALLGEPVR